ncbi:MAG: hypothetical protein HY248_01315, partial [Fimbriimonas ginsengisoli]|nr:hypothetical protein [Fimbriimonas ginsengisoli]
ETEAQKRTNFAAPGIVFFVITVTLAVTDWVMSLDAHWYSTMFGPLFVVGPALGALALCTLIVCVNADKSPFNQIMSLSLTKDLGNMLFTLNLFWAYFNFSQFIIYWNGNLPTPAGYYFHRSADGWNFIGGFLIVFQFLVPFFALMTPRIKASPRALAWVCGWLILMRFLDVYYIVTPMYRTTGPMVHWQDIVALLGVGGIWLAAFGSQVKGASVYPVHDMRLMEAVEHA